MGTVWRRCLRAQHQRRPCWPPLKPSQQTPLVLTRRKQLWTALPGTQARGPLPPAAPRSSPSSLRSRPSSPQTRRTKITSATGLTCSDAEKTSLATSSSDLASAKESVDGSLATIKEDLEIATGSAPTDSEISSATTAAAS